MSTQPPLQYVYLGTSFHPQHHCGGWRAGIAVTWTNQKFLKYLDFQLTCIAVKDTIEKLFSRRNSRITSKPPCRGTLPQGNDTHTMNFKTLWIVQRSLEEVFKSYNFPQVKIYPQVFKSLQLFLDRKLGQYSLPFRIWLTSHRQTVCQ